MNNPIYLMTSAYPQLQLKELLDKAKKANAQGLELCVFRQDSDRNDHIATHLDYENFDLDTAKTTLDIFNQAGLRFCLGAFDNLIGGNPQERLPNQNHILKLIRIAHLLGGNANNVTVGTFVGYNHDFSHQENGFERNLEEYRKIFTPIVKYAEDLGVTLTYENCPMEGWRSAHYSTTYNNLPATLAARKLMYALIPSKAHGEIYDPSHDIWQHVSPIDVIEHSDFSRIKMVHIKSTRNLNSTKSIHWGGLYGNQNVSPSLAEKAGVPIAEHEWDRHNYEPTLPGFGGGDNLDWRTFLDNLMRKGYSRPFSIENEAALSKGSENDIATDQGFQAAVLNVSPCIWNLGDEGYQYKPSGNPLAMHASKNIPVTTMKDVS